MTVPGNALAMGLGGTWSSFLRNKSHFHTRLGHLLNEYGWRGLPAMEKDPTSEAFGVGAMAFDVL